MKQSSESKKLIPLYLRELFLEKTDETHPLNMEKITNYLATKNIFADRRTIYDGISLLKIMGFDIWGKRNNDSYDYYYTNRTFSNTELKFLIDSVAASRFLTEQKSKELIEKIKSLDCADNRESLNRNVLLGDRVKSINDMVFKNLDSIYAAIRSNHKITFNYMTWTPQHKLVAKEQGYSVSPFAVTLNDDNYYLIAFCDRHQSIRHYRIDKMQDTAAATDIREGIELFRRFNIANYTQKTFGMFGGKEETIRLECDNSLVGVLIDRFGGNITIRPNYDNPNTSIARINVTVSPQFYAWIFALGTQVKIVAPKSAIQEFSTMLSTINKHYRD